MSNHLFKLKKDGKCVGYLELRIRTPYGYPVLWFRNLSRLDEGREWHSGNNVQADSIHPFVTKDKHGKDVFADDPVWFHWKGKKTKGKIIKEGLFWKYESVEKHSRTLCKFDIAHIELIEGKDG